MVGFAALGYWAFARAGSKVAVVAAARDIPLGHVITRSDLTTAEVAGGVTAVSAAHLDGLLGKTAAVEIVPDTLIQQAMVTSRTGLRVSQAIVGVAVGPGQVPPTGLQPGDRVEVLGLPGQQNTASTAVPTVLADGAVVVDEQANPATAGGVLVSVMVPKTAAAGIAAASSAELVALVQVGR